MSKPMRTRAERGQVLPFSAAFLVVCLALFLFAANTAQMSVEKTRVTNAADAAAYSAGVVHARALNFSAYSNRAIIANQVAVAQSLSLLNELNHIASTYTATDASVVETMLEGGAWSSVPGDEDGRERFATHGVLAAGSLIAQFYGYSPEQFINYIIPYTNYVGAALVSAASFASLILEVQQAALWAPSDLTLNHRAMRAAKEVAHAMDPQIDVDYLWLGPLMRGEITQGAPAIVTAYDGDDRRRLLNVIMDSLDPVILNRDENAYSALLRVCSGARTGFERRGGTRMSDDMDYWIASDRQAYRYLRPSWINPCRTRTADQFEGATARVGGGIDEDGEGSYVSYVHNDESLDSYLQYARYNGMATIYDIDEPTETSALQHRAGFTVLAQKRKVHTNTSGHTPAVTPTGDLDLYGGVPTRVPELAALSRAQILYHRPPRSDGRLEYPSLYNPFWTVRLTQPEAADYVEQAAIRFAR
jgi:hypothetical protein